LRTNKADAVKPAAKLLYIFIFLVIAGVFAAIYMYNNPQKDLLRHEADFTLTASELHSEFTTDESAANLKYIGKIIELKGKVTSINIESDKAVSIILDTKDEMSSVICTFRESMDPRDINTMEPVTVRGELSGFLMNVLLNNCIMIK
jgi:hypothetical protein